MSYDADGEALKKLKKKMLMPKFEGKLLTGVWIDEAVGLAQVTSQKGKSNPDWDPLDHPKDSEGKFTEKHEATFSKGKFKTAKFVNKYGDAHEIQLAPGEKLHKLPSGNHVVEHLSGEITYASDTKDSFGTDVLSAGKVLSPNSFGAKVVKDPESPTVVAENSVEAPEIHENNADHPDLNINIQGGTVFIHPVSGLTVDLEPGQTFYQHKASSNSYILVNEGGQTGTFFNKHGKAIASNPSTKVWTLKNYKQIWPEGASKTTAVAIDNAQQELKDEAAVLKKLKQEALDKPSPIAEKLAKTLEPSLDAWEMPPPKGAPEVLDELADWEKELLSTSTEPPAETAVNEIQLPNGLMHKLQAGEKLYSAVDGSIVYVKSDGDTYAYVGGSGNPWAKMPAFYWTDNGYKYSEYVPGAAKKPKVVLLTGDDEGTWGSVKNPAGGKIQLYPGDKVFAKDLYGGSTAIVVLTPGGSDVAGIGTLYSSNGNSDSVNSLHVYEENELWYSVASIPLTSVSLKQGKALEAKSSAELTEVITQGFKQIAEDLGLSESWAGGYSASGVSPENFVSKFSSPKAQTRISNLLATIDDFNGETYSSPLKYSRDGLIMLQKIVELTQALQANSSDVQNVENRFADVFPEVSYPTLPPGFPWNNSYGPKLKSVMLAWRAQQKMTQTLGFELESSTLTQKHQFMVSKGLTSAGALTDEQSKQWIKAKFEDDIAVLQALESLASFNVAQAQAGLQLKKLMKAQPAEAPVADAVKAVAAQSKAFQNSLKNLATVYRTDSNAEFLLYKGHDTWANYLDGEKLNEFTTQQVLQVLEGGNWIPDSLGTIGGAKTLGPTLEAWEKVHQTSLEAASSKVLNAFLKSNGGNYVALMKASHKRDWVRFHLAGDEVAKWQLEWQLADNTYHLHKWESTHPGSFSSPEGVVARQATSDMLAQEEWFIDLADQLGAPEPDWGGVYKLSNTQVFLGFTALGLDTRYDKESTPTLRREALFWWLNSRGRLPKSQVSAPVELAPPVLEDPKTAEVPASISLPAGINPKAWELVLAAEAGLDEIHNLKSNMTFSAGTMGLDPQNNYPPLIKTLTEWAFSGSYSNPELSKAKLSVREAVFARAKSGVWAPPTYKLLVTKGGTKHPIPPGYTVYKDVYSNFVVVSPDEKTGYEVGSSDGWVASLDQYELQSKMEVSSLLFKVPKSLTFAEATEDGLTSTEFNWNAVAEIEQKPASQVTFPGWGLASQPSPMLTEILKQGATPPYIKANAEKLPDGVKVMAAWAMKNKHQAVLDTIEWKLKKGYYANSKIEQVLDPSASYYSYIMSGQSSADDMWNYWPESVSNALGEVVGYKAKDGYWSPVELQKLHDALQATLNPAAPSLSTSTKKSGLPEELLLTPIDKSLGGMHSKQAWKDQLGNEWMSKSYKSDPNAGARVDAEHTAMAIGRLFGTHSPDTRTMQLQGVYQYVQYLKPANGDLSGRTPDSLNDEQLSQVMEEHVLDWLNSNHDSHPMNLLLDPNDQDVIPIDKGQAWRFFGEDKLAVGYLPPSNPIPVWYDQFYYAVQSGKLDQKRLDKITKRVLSKAYAVQSKRDKETRDLLTQAFAKRVEFSGGYSTSQQFVDGVMARKASLLSDFEDFYKDLYASGGYSWNIDVDQLKKPQLNAHTHTSVSDQFVADVATSGVYGKALMVNSTDFEDAHVLVYTEKTAKGKDLAGQAMVRKEADKVITNWLKSQLVETDTNSVVSAQSTDYETAGEAAELPMASTWYSALVAAAKTVNHHVSDGEYNQSTLDNLKTYETHMKLALAQLDNWEQKNPEKPFKQHPYEMKTAEQQAAWRAMIVRYLEDVDRVFEAQKNKTKVEPHISMVEYVPSEGLNTSGTPKPSIVLTKNGSTLTVWDDLNYTLQNDKAVLKITANNYKDLIKSGEWKLKPASVELVEGEPEVWVFAPKKGAKVTWTKQPGAELWTSSASATMTDAQLQEVIVAKPQLWSFEGPQVEDEAVVSVGQKTFKVFKRQSYATKGEFDYDSGELTASDTHLKHGQTGYQYDIEYGDVTIQYRPWTEPGVKKSQQGLLRFKVKNWDGSTDQVEDVLDTLRTVGLDLSEADEESLQLFYWRHLYGVMQERNDTYAGQWGKVTASIEQARSKNPKMSASEELAAWKEAWAEGIGADKVEAAEWKPKFSRFNTHVTGDKPEFTAGHPYWHRPDMDLNTVKEHWGSNLALTSVGDISEMSNIVLSGGMLSTEERIRVLGQWVSGMSSSDDQGWGSAGWVFTRQNRGTGGQIFYHPRVALRTSNYSWDSDLFGKTHLRKESASFTPSTMLSHSYDGNELMIKNGLSFLDDIAVVVFPNQEARQKVLTRYKELGITMLHGVPIEELFVTDSYQAEKAIAKVWKTVLEEAKK